MQLFQELQRRNVFRVSIGYIVSSWLLVQVADLVLENIGSPDWAMQTIMLVLALGFPVVVFFSWAYEVTPEGIKLESEIDRTQSITHLTGRKLDRAIVAVLLIALAYFAYDKFILDPQRDAALVEGMQQVATEHAKVESEVTAETDKSIAVLPFVNMSDDAGNEYFSDGLSEELLNMLVQIPELQVAARTSAFSYKGKDVKIAQIAKELSVAHVLEGSVRKSGDRVRITAQLIEAENGFHLWSKTYNRTLEDIFAVQDEIAASVVQALKVSLLGAMPTRETTNPEVYALYLQGRYFDNLKGKENWEKAVSAFKQALAIDPEYAPAWINIAQTYQYQANAGVMPYEETVGLARAAVERALVIDENLAPAWASLSYQKKFYDWDWQGAKAAIDKALQLEPKNELVVRASASMASTLGQTSKAIGFYERGAVLDPLNLSNLSALGQAYTRAGRLDEAIETFGRLVALNPEYPWGYSHLGRIYLLKGDAERALLEIEKNPAGFLYEFELAQTHHVLRNEEKSQAYADKFIESYSDRYAMRTSELYAWRGDIDTAFEWLERAYQQRDGGLSYLLDNVYLRNLESDPRYPVFLEKMGLLEAWNAMSFE